MWYDVGIQELNAGASAAYAAVDIASSVPATASMVTFDAILTPTGAADLAHLQPTGATGATGYASAFGPCCRRCYACSANRTLRRYPKHRLQSNWYIDA